MSILKISVGHTMIYPKNQILIGESKQLEQPQLINSKQLTVNISSKQ